MLLAPLKTVSYTPPHVARDSLGTPWRLLGDSLGTSCILWTPWGLLWDSLGTPLGLLRDSLGVLGDSTKSLSRVYMEYMETIRNILSNFHLGQDLYYIRQPNSN